MLSNTQFERVLKLNNIHAKETSYLEIADLERLIKRSYLTKTIGELDAFLIAMNHASPMMGSTFPGSKNVLIVLPISIAS